MSDIDFITNVKRAETEAESIRLDADLCARETMEQAREEAATIISQAYAEAIELKKTAEAKALAEATTVSATPYPIELEFSNEKIELAINNVTERIVGLLGNS